MRQKVIYNSQILISPPNKSTYMFIWNFKCCLEVCETAPERWQDIFENIVAENRIALKLDIK